MHRIVLIINICRFSFRFDSIRIEMYAQGFCICYNKFHKSWCLICTLRVLQPIFLFVCFYFRFFRISFLFQLIFRSHSNNYAFLLTYVKYSYILLLFLSCRFF